MMLPDDMPDAVKKALSLLGMMGFEGDVFIFIPEAESGDPVHDLDGPFYKNVNMN